MASQSDGWVPVERKKKPPPQATPQRALPVNRPGGGQSYNCSLCRVHCTSPADLATHLAGKKHAEAKRNAGLVTDSPWLCATCKLAFDSALALTHHNLSKGHIARAYKWLQEDDNACLPQVEKSQPWRCHVCDVMCTGIKNLEMHVNGVKHAAKLAQLEFEDLEPWPEEEAQPSILNGKLERPRPLAAFPDAEKSPTQLAASSPELEEALRGFRASEEQSPAWTPQAAPARDPDQEFLDELLGNTAGPSGWVELSNPNPPNGRSASGLSTGPNTTAHATTQGEMSVKEVMCAIRGFFSCSLTEAVANDPVVASDGHTYEREAIEAWMKHNRFSPVTKQPLPGRRVIPNLLVKQATTMFWGSGQLPGAD